GAARHTRADFLWAAVRGHFRVDSDGMLAYARHVVRARAAHGASWYGDSGVVVACLGSIAPRMASGCVVGRSSTRAAQHRALGRGGGLWHRSWPPARSWLCSTLPLRAP